MDDNNDPTNACFDNLGFNSANSLTHLLDEDPNEFPCITLLEYVDVETFGKQLSKVKSKLSILSLNIQTYEYKVWWIKNNTRQYKSTSPNKRHMSARDTSWWEWLYIKFWIKWLSIDIQEQELLQSWWVNYIHP